jgi:hypothetical protein
MQATESALTFHNGTFDAPRYTRDGVAAPWSALSVFELDEMEMDLRDMEADFANEMSFVRSKIAKQRNNLEVAPDVDCSGSWL